MVETPREVHNRIVREAIEHIHEFSQFHYVAYTEHLSSEVVPFALHPGRY